MEIVRTADRVADFCRKTCIKLECCPNLFGPRMVLDRCSENCSVLTKTKYSKWIRLLQSSAYHWCQLINRLTFCRCELADKTASHNECFTLSLAYYYGKKKSKRVGRPPGGHTNLEGGVKRRGRRRKRRKQLFVHKKRRSSASVDNTPVGSPQVLNP